MMTKLSRMLSSSSVSKYWLRTWEGWMEGRKEGRKGKKKGKLSTGAARRSNCTESKAEDSTHLDEAMEKDKDEGGIGILLAGGDHIEVIVGNVHEGALY